MVTILLILSILSMVSMKVCVGWSPAYSSVLRTTSSLATQLSSQRLFMTEEIVEEPPQDLKPTRGKGFGKVEEVKKEEKDIGTLTYERQAKRGVPEYNIFFRPRNGTDAEWLPVGSMTIPRDQKVSHAVYEVEEELLKGAFKLFPKLRTFHRQRVDNGEKEVFEYGYCLKAFPDEPIVLIEREKEKQEEGNFFTNWLSRLTDPVDTSALRQPAERGSLKTNKE